MSQQQRILFVSLFNDVGSDRIVAAMARLGASCGVLAARDAFAARSRFVDRVFALPGFGGYWGRRLFLGARLARIVGAWHPTLVIPLDELSALALRDPRLYRKASSEVRALLERSLGYPAGFEVARGRHRLVDMAGALGIATPPQHAVDTAAVAERIATELGYPVVLKREQTCGGAGVVIVDGPEMLAAAYKRCAFKAAAKRQMQRLLGIAASTDSALVLQGHVSGPLAFRIVACAAGKVLEGMSFQSECVHPAVTGASTILRPIERPDMGAAAEKLVAALGCSGLVSLDFILPPEGAAVLIEMNPRPVASGHLGRLYGHDVYAALLAAHEVRVPAIAAPVAEGPELVALFPRELDRDPASVHAAAPRPGVLHDLPVDDPGVVATYARWLEERHPADRIRLRQLFVAMTGADVRTPVRAQGRWAAALADRCGRLLAHLQGPRLVK